MKNSITKINCAQTFFFKSRCKFCLSGPKYIFFMLNKMVSEHTLYKVKEFLESQIRHAPIRSRSDNFYIGYAVENRNFSASYLFDGFSSQLQKLPIPNIKYQQNDDKINTVIECSCGQTSWSFTNSNRKHISNRKCNISMGGNDVVSLYKVMF